MQSEFFKNSRSSDGLQTQCKICSYRHKANRRVNPEIHQKDLQRRRNWLKTDKGIASKKLSANSHYNKSKENGRCTSCGINLENRVRAICFECNEKLINRTKARHDSRIALGRCFQCGTEEVIKGDKRPVCKTCFLKLRASSALGDSRFWKILKNKLAEQNYRCVYSGKLLVLGETASIDHILPIARFPELAKEITNIQWVDIVVNQMKRDLTPKEFLSLVEIIHHHENQKPVIVALPNFLPEETNSGLPINSVSTT